MVSPNFHRKRQNEKSNGSHLILSQTHTQVSSVNPPPQLSPEFLLGILSGLGTDEKDIDYCSQPQRRAGLHGNSHA